LLPDDSADRIARELWRTNQVFSVDTIPPWFSTLIDYRKDKQWTLWWPQFRDVV
jgi:hypothetical protein